MTTNQEFIEKKVFEFCENNDKNLNISSDKYFKFPCCLGIDEAGRGPVLGPMVYAGAYIEIRNLERLNDIGLDDSKKLKEETRENLLSILADSETKTCGYEVEIISPNFISNQMLNVEKTNLNTISHDSAINIIRKVIAKGVDLKEVYIDTVGSADKYQALILSHFPKLKVVVTSKADSIYKIVSAASIFAKVVRDNCIKNWKYRERINFPIEGCGSGYPSDPATKEFMRKTCDPVFGFPQFVRSSWSTASSIMEKDCLEIQWEDCDVAHDNKHSKSTTGKRSSSSMLIGEKSNKSLLDFYAPSVPVDKRHSFFLTRKLERISSLD